MDGKTESSISFQGWRFYPCKVYSSGRLLSCLYYGFWQLLGCLCRCAFGSNALMYVTFEFRESYQS